MRLQTALSKSLPPGTLLILAFNCIQPAEAQVLGDYPIVAVSQPSDCESVVEFQGVSASLEQMGVLDFWIYPIDFSTYGEIDAVRFGITWPQGWTVKDVELCNGTAILEGSIGTPGAGVTLTIEQDPFVPHRPAVRMRIDASSPGAFGLIAHPDLGELGFRDVVSGTWHHYWPEYPSNPGDLSPFYVVIGEEGPCSDPPPYPGLPGFCLLISWGPPGSLLVPGVVTVPGGAAWVDTVSVEAPECYVVGIPECGGWPYPGTSCLAMISSETPWLSFGEISWDEPQNHNVHGTLEMRIDATKLEPGAHEVRALLIPNQCSGCFIWCTRFVVDVTPLSVEPTTWGQLKARGAALK